MWTVTVCTGLRPGSRLQTVASDQKGDSWDWDCACQGIFLSALQLWAGVGVELSVRSEALVNSCQAPWLNDWVQV